MRQVISEDTGKEQKFGNMKTDVSIDADGEGGVFLGMCWHEVMPLGSVMARIEPDKVQGFIESIQKASKDKD